ncbi:MAG: hypothetical protein QXW76_02515 [Candidatus Korarchaeum sp.]
MSLADDLLKELEKNPELAKRFARKLIEYIEPDLSVPVQIGKLVEQMNRVAEEQKGLREDFNEMLKRVDRNTRAITQLRGAIRGLLEAQAKSEERLSRLEVAVDKLVTAVAELRVEVGRLSDTAGYGLEDMVPGERVRSLQ